MKILRKFSTFLKLMEAYEHLTDLLQSNSSPSYNVSLTFKFLVKAVKFSKNSKDFKIKIEAL